MDFKRRLDSAVTRALVEQDEEMGGMGVGLQAAGLEQNRKAAADLTRSAEQASNALSNLKQTIEASGHGGNEAIGKILEQVEWLSGELKKDGNLSQTLQTLVQLPAPEK
jgi:hypothetical protein